MRLMKTLTFVIFMAMASSAFSETAYIESCNDGDTCKAYIGSTSQRVTVRLAGVDAPEADQEYGDLAQIKIESLIRGQEVQLECEGHSYRRSTCRIFLDDVDVGGWMVENGWAFEVIFYSKGRYTQAQRFAKREGLGLWGLGFKQSPVCFREKGREQCRRNPHFGITE